MLRPLAASLAAVLLVAGCQQSSAPKSGPAQPPPTHTGSTAPAPAGGSARAASAAWPLFGYTPARRNAAPAARGLSAAALASMRSQEVQLAGVADSSPIYLPGARVHGSAHDLLVVTTSYGRVEAVDARSGRILWRFTPRGYERLAGSAQITQSSPAADPGGRYLYTASPDGLVHKLRTSDGREVEAGAWPARVTLDPTHEKIGTALNVRGPYVIATTGGYIGDAPPYQGHVALIERASGRLAQVWNSLCSDRRGLIQPSSCPSSDSAIWARAGAVVVPGSGRMLVATGNGPWDGRSDWGDSVLLLSPRARLLGSYTPGDQRDLEQGDVDLGSTAPALLARAPGRPLLAVQGGKDGVLRLLSLRRMVRGLGRLGGELSTIAAPGGSGVFTAPASWRQGGRTLLAVANGSGTALYRLVSRGGARLVRVWQNGFAGTSPVLAGGLLYVYDPGGRLRVYRPASPAPVAELPAPPGHWSSPIVAGDAIALPSGNANDHGQRGLLTIYRPR